MTFTHSSTFSNFTYCSSKPQKWKPPPPATTRIPARELKIDFGKYKGKMLGTLPSTYLKWVSNNLRAGDFEHWAKLAHQVLVDPVYKDRLEWEFADSVLTGKRNNNSNNAVSELLEISERFGWDNEDKVGWSKVNFELLGTSKSGRIPRIGSSSSFSSSAPSGEFGVKKSLEKDDEVVVESGEKTRREIRRGRVRMKREVQMKEKKLGMILGKFRDTTVDTNGDDGGKRLERKYDKDRTVDIYSPFPGREALLKNVLDRKRVS